MKTTLKIIGISLGILLSIIVLFLAWVEFTDLPKYDVHPINLKIPKDSASILHGKQIALVYCASCHLGQDGKLSGRQFTLASNKFGEIWTGNITQHPSKGTGRYTDGELAYLLRTGVKRNGNMAGYFMSSLQMSDDDQAAIIAFLRSDDKLVESSDIKHPDPDFSLFAKILIKLDAFKPLPYDGKAIISPSPSDKINYGRYLATGRYECFRCHSKSFETNDLINPEKSEGYFTGGNLIEDEDFKSVNSPNITFHKIKGIGSWTYEQFAQTIKTGARPDGRILSSIMPRFATVSDEETQALWAYLQNIPIPDTKAQKSGM